MLGLDCVLASMLWTSHKPVAIKYVILIHMNIND